MFIKYEEMLLNIRPAPYQLLNQGFLINFAGRDLFTSSVHPLYERNVDRERKIDSCERFFKAQDMAPSFRIVFQKDYQFFDEELFRRGYEKTGQGLVKQIEIKKIQDELFTFASFIENGIFVDEILKEFWLSEHYYLMNFDEEQELIFEDAINRVPLKAVYFTFVEQNTLLGQGLAMFEGNTMIIHTLVINEKFRNLSYGRRLLMSMLSYGLRSGAKKAITDIELNHSVAMKLFDKVGFEDLYAYWYRKKF